MKTHPSLYQNLWKTPQKAEYIYHATVTTPLGYLCFLVPLTATKYVSATFKSPDTDEQ